MNWICPTLQRSDDGQVHILTPDPYPCISGGHLTVEELPHVDRCQAMLSEHRRDYPCGLVRGHVGPHWQMDPEFAALIPPLQIVAHLVVA